MKPYTFEFLTRDRAFNRKTTDDRPKPDRVVTVEAVDETEATLAAYAQLKPREIRNLVCANVVRP